MIDGATLEQAARLLERLRATRTTVATAESCTGGLVAAALTHHAGSSAGVLGGFVCYSNAMKTALLGVDAALLNRVGAVSGEVAAAMAEGAAVRSAADLSVSVTGIAGPGGATPDKPVGLVWFGIADRHTRVRTERHVFEGDRETVRRLAVGTALRLLDRALDDASS